MGDFLKFWGRCFLEGWEMGHGAFTVVEIVSGVVLLTLLYFKKIKTKEREKWEEKAVKTALCVFMASFLIATFFIAPFVQFDEADSARNTATNELFKLKNNKPTPIRTKYIHLADQLLDRVDEADKRKSEWKEFRYRAVFWNGILSEFQGRIERSVTELAEHGQRSEKFNELAMRLEINYLEQSIMPSALRDMANEMKRMAENDDE